MSAAMKKFEVLLNRFEQKFVNSQVKVPGFIIGLSGTDSITAFRMLYRLAQRRGMARKQLYGVHYVDSTRKKPTWFEREIIPWMREQFPFSTIEVVTPLGGNRDPQRWADLSLRSLNAVDHKTGEVTPLPEGQNYWVVDTINATEWELGSFSNAARIASVSPLRSLWKSEIMEICEAMGVPQIALDYARMPDCLCGRAELAAANIEVIDDILRYRLDPTLHEPFLLGKLYEYITAEKQYNGFKTRIPYVL